jgi:hypothetical protein
MKKAKYLFFTIIISLTTLSVLGENNFGAGFGFSFQDAEPKITQQEVQDEVRIQLTDPLTKCYIAAHPGMRMMKCASYMKFEFSGHSARYLEPDTKFNSTYGIQGEVIFDNCGQETHVASVMLNFSKEDKVMVQESFFSEWVSAADYVTDFCAKMDEMKVEE